MLGCRYNSKNCWLKLGRCPPLRNRTLSRGRCLNQPSPSFRQAPIGCFRLGALSPRSRRFLHYGQRTLSKRLSNCLNQSIMEIPGFKGVILSKMEQLEERVILHVSMPKMNHICPNCKKKTIRVHDYRI